MKKILLIVSLIFVLVSCDKDLYHPPLTCKVSSFDLHNHTSYKTHLLNAGELFLAFTDMHSIQYDAQGRPVSAKNSSPDTACHFEYNNLGQLSRFTAYPMPPIVAGAHYWTFAYGLGIITVTAGSIIRETGQDIIHGTVVLTVDNLQRVIRSTRPDGSYTRYEFDNNFNLQWVYDGSPQGVETLGFEYSDYDSYQNFANTHKVWQLLLNNFSNNNPGRERRIPDNFVWRFSYEYNAENLPVTYLYHSPDNPNWPNTSSIGYQCANATTD